MQESEIARSRDRSSKVENRRSVKNAKTMNINENAKNVRNEMLNRRKQAFQDFTTRESSQFERVEVEMTTIHDEIMNSKTALAVHRADSASGRRRGRERDRERERSRDRGRRGRERGQVAMSKET